MRVCDPDVHDPTSYGEWVWGGLLILAFVFMVCYVFGKAS